MTTATEAAKLFRDMADRLDRVSPAEFGGAFLIVPPEGTVLDSVTVASAPTLMAYWASLGGQVDVAISDVRKTVEQQVGYGGRR